MRVLAVAFPMLVPWGASAAPRAAAVVVAPPGTDATARATLARAAIEALDRVAGVEPVRAAALREGLVPKVDAPDPMAHAHALAAAAGEVAAADPVSAARLWERAMELAFTGLAPDAARAWLAKHGPQALASLARAGREVSLAERRIRLWRERAPRGPTVPLEIAIEPEGARVFLDGWPVGAGGKVRVQHEAGSHDLRAELSGYEPAAQRVQIPGPAVTIRLAPVGPAEDLRAAVALLDRAHGKPRDLARGLARLGRRLDAALLFVATPEPDGVLVRLYDAEGGGFAGASPVSAADPATLARAFRALLDLRRTGEAMVGRRRRKKRTGPFREPFWKKWWVWGLVLGGAGVITGGILLMRQGSDDGTLTLRLRRSP